MLQLSVFTRLAVVAAAVMAVGAPGAAAATWAESGDAGDLPASAQAASGVGALTAISGTLPSTNDNDVDMYRICIPAPASFAASTSGTIIDPQQFVFDAAGNGVEANDDIVLGIQRQSRITAGNPHSPTAPGVYFIAISRWNNDALSTGGRIFPDGNPFDGQVVGPTGSGGASPVTAWTGQGDAANENGGTDYTLNLAGTAACLTFAGFGPPIDNGALNTVNAGQTVPVKWNLTDAVGNPVSDPASFVSLTSQSGGGSCGGPPADAVEASPGSSDLQYQGNGDWHLNWKTPKAYAGQCRTMTLTLNDGTTHQASFQFK